MSTKQFLNSLILCANSLFVSPNFAMEDCVAPKRPLIRLERFQAQFTNTPALEDNALLLIQALIAKMDVRIPVIIGSAEEECDEGYDLSSILNSAENTPIASHRIDVTRETLHQLSSHFDDNYHEAIAGICHELGHAKQVENDIQLVSQIKVHYRNLQTQRHNLQKAFDNNSIAEDLEKYKQLLCEYRQTLYAMELYADAAIPNEKPLLLAMRNSLIHGSCPE